MKKNLVAVGLLTSALAASVIVVTGPASAQPAERKAKSYSVTASAKKTDVVVGKKVKIVGKVSPKAIGAKVRLQQRADSSKRWRQESTARVRKNGTFVLKDKPTTVSARFYRVVKPGNRNRRKGVSKPIKVTMYRWLELAKQSARTSDKLYDGPIKMSLKEYPNSLYGTSTDTAGFRDYNLGKLCTRFTAKLGLGDYSDTNAQATLSIKDADTVLFSQSFKLTEYKDVSLAIGDVFRLGVGFEQAADSGGVPAFGSPKVLCSF